MTQKIIFFALDSADRLTNWAERIAIATNAEILGNHEELVELKFLDSFDWLFYGVGVQLRAESCSGVDGKKIILRWVSDDSSLRTPAALYLDQLPKTAADLPAGQMHDLVNKQLDLRSLMPVASVRSRRIKMAIFDKESKTRCRLILEHNYARPGGSRRSIDLGCCLRLEAMVGYEKVFNKTSKLLEKLKGVTCVQDDIFENAVKASGRIPGDYCSRIKTSLKRDLRVDEACRLILLDQLDQLEWNIKGAIANIDSEFLHDLRVATRRSRALLSRMKNAFPISVYKRFSKELAWLGENTTSLRDLDVFMLDFPEYYESLGPELRSNLMPFYDFLSARYKTEQVILIKTLKSKRFENFCTKWRAYLEKPSAKNPRGGLRSEPIGKVADIRIWKTYRRLVREGLCITDSSPATDLHELRKTCKKLRYLLEFFSDLYPKKQIKKLINEQKDFQENLGAFQDLQVQGYKIKHFIEEMSVEGEIPKKTFMAMEVLIANMKKEEKRVRTEFAQRAAKYYSIEVEKGFRNLCGRDTPAKKKYIKKTKKDNTAGLTK